jgi:hypothetical protein
VNNACFALQRSFQYTTMDEEQRLVSVRYVPLVVGVVGELLQGECCCAAAV